MCHYQYIHFIWPSREPMRILIFLLTHKTCSILGHYSNILFVPSRTEFYALSAFHAFLWSSRSVLIWCMFSFLSACLDDLFVLFLWFLLFSFDLASRRNEIVGHSCLMCPMVTNWIDCILVRIVAKGKYHRLYNNQINPRTLIGQSAVGYCAGKPTEKSCVFCIII